MSTLMVGADQHFYLFLLDLHTSPAVEAVAASCPLPHLLLRMPPHFFMQGGWGNSFSLLEGFRYAASLAIQLQSKLVYLVEEEVFVSADFFQFHRQVQLGRKIAAHHKQWRGGLCSPPAPSTCRHDAGPIP